MTIEYAEAVSEPLAQRSAVVSRRGGAVRVPVQPFPAVARSQGVEMSCGQDEPMTPEAEPRTRTTRDRDTADFEAFVHARLPHLLKFGRALAGDEERGADLVQDALERTFMRWSMVRDGDPEGYIRRAMVNRSISVWRKLHREQPLTALQEPQQTDRPRDHELLDAVRQLPARQRAVIALRYYEDLTEPQTAVVLGCSIGTVKSQSSRAMATLRTQLPTFADREEM